MLFSDLASPDILSAMDIIYLQWIVNGFHLGATIMLLIVAIDLLIRQRGHS